jgi:O-antigen ligase
VTWTGALYRSLVLLYTSFAAVYLSRRYSLEELIKILFWVGVIFSFASVFFAIAFPAVGRDFNPPFNGAWRGIFWHKNHLGNIMPFFNLVFLLRIFKRSSSFIHAEKILAVIFYILSLVLIYQANSASGYILFLILHFVFFILAVWVKLHPRLIPAHYWMTLALMLIIVFLIASNLDLVLGLFNRQTSLTGRIPLWEYLIEQVFSKRPIFGFGFGSLWTMESFRISTQKIVNWGYPVMMGDNGFIDILLNGGIVGLMLFLVVYVQSWIESIRYSMAHREITGLFPAIFMLYTLFVNVSFSMFLELESMIWLICVFLLFINFPRPIKEHKQPA